MSCISVFVLGMNINAFAGSMGAEGPKGEHWTIGGSALIMQPELSDPFNFAKVVILDASNINSTEYYSVRPSYTWGFDVFVAYNFIDSARDIRASYMGFWSNDKKYLDAPEFPFKLPMQFAVSATGSVSNHIDAADILAGQSVMLNNAVRLHGALGVGFAHLDKVNSALYINQYDYLGEIHGAYLWDNATFNGAGPKLALDGEYIIHASRFSLVGGLSLALLVGSQSNNGVNAQSSGLIPAFTHYFNENTQDTTVTNVNANLGLRYYVNTTVPLSAEVGYKVYQYINYVSLSGGYLTLAASFG